MALPALLAPVVGFLFRDVVVKFLVFGALYAVLLLVGPLLVGLVTPWLSTTALSAAFSSLGPTMGWLLQAFAFDVGIPAVISAYITRFSIRRLPVVG